MKEVVGKIEQLSDEPETLSLTELQKRLELNKALAEHMQFSSYPAGSFSYELEQLINEHSIEGGSDTPDFILAQYLKNCLDNFDMCVRKRDDWYGREG